MASPAAHAATFTVINNDGPGEGFNDPTPVAPVGGNLGTTLGAQRLIAFQRAADIWGALLSSAVTIRVSATFDPLACNATSAILGSAGPLTAFRDFGGALVGSTWYPSALANALHGTDLDGSNDINAQFNSAFGTTCAFPRGWYYGLDGNAGGNIDFVTVLLHELGHGLGFVTLVDLATGAKALGLNDTFMRNLENHGASPADYPSMTNAQRVAASTSTGNLHWVGPNVRAASGALGAGTVGDHVRMFAPNPQQAGSSVAHWDTALFPNQLLEPVYTTPMDPGLELALFRDIGWTVLSSSVSVSLTPNPASGPSPLSTTLTAALSGPVTGTINYTFWWNCTDPGTSVSAVTATCGDPTNPSIGAKFNGVTSTSQSVTHVYASPGGFTAKVIAEPGTAAAVETRATVTVSAPPQVLHDFNGDFNGDGKADILWRHTPSGLVAMWLMDGVSIATNVGIATIPLDWSIVGVGDFNGDGKADILWRNTTTGQVAMWLMNGVSIATNVGIATIPLDWSIVGVADFNGDGKADILRRNSTSGQVAMWLMNGVSIATNVDIATIPADWSIVRVGDFNGDGKADILWRQTPSGLVAMWLMNGGSIAGNLGIATIPADWSIVGAGDFNGDGKADILWRQTPSGLVAMWLMNGGSIAGNLGIATIPTSWATP